MRITLTINKITPSHSTFYASFSSISIKSCLTFISAAFLFAAFSMNASAALSLAEFAAIQHEAEHKAALDLVPINASARQVVQSGAWSNPATWSDNKLPVAGENVYVPSDKSLLVDVANNFGIGKLRVDGIITFARNMKVKLKLDTLVVTETGAIEIGTENEHIPANQSVEIIIANNGPINRTADPKNLSRGVIILGRTRMFGTDKSAFHKLALNPALGATQITLTEPPTGWAKDDIIAITATKFSQKSLTPTKHVTQDELRRIQSISGNIITLGKVDGSNTVDPLQYSHIPAIPDMPVYVANLTRNVTITGEGGDSIPAGQRGHFVVMHNPDAIIKGTGFYYLGRTDKSKPLDDFKLGANYTRLKDASGNFIPGANNNPRGRYSVHFHHTGVSDRNAPPAIFSGNAVFSSPGWGVVNHTSHVNIENNASYNVFGSHFAAEDGNELGTFKHNIAIKSEGRWRAYIKTGQNNHDMGHTGHGLWLESRNLEVEDNVISGVNSGGIVYWHRNYIPGINLWIPRNNLLTEHKDIVKNALSIFYENIPITHDKNNTVLASGEGMDIIKAVPNQQHDVRSIIESFKAYSVLSGLNIDYSERYTFKNMEIVADPLTRKWHQGLLISTKTNDIVAHNSSINGFVHPVITGTSLALKPTEAFFVNVKVNDRPITPTDIQKQQLDIANNYNPSYQHIINSSSELSPSALNFTPNSNQSPNFPISYNKSYYVQGTKTDSLGQVAYFSKWFDRGLIETVRKGYFTDSQGNKYVYLPETISDRLTGETRTFNIKLKLVSRFNEAITNLGPLP